MNLKEKWLSLFELSNTKEDIFKNIRQEAISVFQQKGFPTKKDEAWKFTSLKELLTHDFSLVAPTEKEVKWNDIEPFLIDADNHRVVFVDGVFCAELSQITTDEFEIVPLAEVIASNNTKFTEKFNQQTPKDEVFTAINTAFASEGICISIPKSKAIAKPVELLFVGTALRPACHFPRNMIIVGENAQVKIIETHQSLSQQKTLTNAVTEILVAQNAFLDYYKVQNDTPSASMIDNTYIWQDKNSNASVHTFSFGGEITRNNLNFFHQGDHLESTLKGVSILNSNQLVDNYTLVHHAQPNCESHQDYKAILSDSSSGVFNGKIMVDKIAQKTNAYQQNDTILLSDKATINAKPQLEIFADDVKCSHGCTIGEMNKEALFYLQTRGIPKKEAEALLTYGFAHSVLESVKIEKLKTFVETLIANKLGVNINM